ncbi:MAG: putative acetyltransferase [Spirosomataceae bacterium]|jgi:putative acetyltransferase
MCRADGTLFCVELILQFMLTILRTDSQNSDFKTIVKPLDKGLGITDGDDYDFYNQFNKIENIKYVVIIYDEK